MRYYPVTLSDGTLLSLPSVTSVLNVTMSPERRSRLDQAEISNPAKTFLSRETARRRGSFIHRYASTILAGKAMGHGEYHKHLKGLDPWLGRIKLLPALNTDGFVYRVPSPNLRGYAGTFDLVYRDINHGLTLVEIKTTDYMVHEVALESAKLQAAAYAIASDSQSAEQIAAVQTVFVSRYRVTTDFVHGAALVALKQQWEVRLRQFATRLTEAAE